jgi:hypothetical protein
MLGLFHPSTPCTKTISFHRIEDHGHVTCHVMRTVQYHRENNGRKRKTISYPTAIKFGRRAVGVHPQNPGAKGLRTHS